MADQRRSERLDQPREPTRITVPRLDPEAFGRWSEGIARYMGTANFIAYMTVVIALWLGWNTLTPPHWRFDPYTFTFLTLVLSLQASYAAPLILLAQDRQAARDRLAMEEDRRRAAMQKADTEYLSREIAALRIAVGEVATRDFVRAELTRLLEELDEPGRHEQARRGEPARPGQPARHGQRRDRRQQHRYERDRAHRHPGDPAQNGPVPGDPAAGPAQAGPSDEPNDEVDGD